MSRYFSVDEMFAEDERIPVRWLSDARAVGYLDPSSGGADVARGAAMDLPLWLAEELKQRNLVEVALPAHFSRKSRADITADAVAARLRDKSPHFYSVGLRLAPLLSVAKEGEELSKDVHAALADRAAGILAGGGQWMLIRRRRTSASRRRITGSGWYSGPSRAIDALLVSAWWSASTYSSTGPASATPTT
jgi:hypothetical protein